MKILHVLYDSIPKIAGSSIRSRDIITSQLAAGLEIIVVTSPFQEPLTSGMEVEIIEGVKHYRTFSGNTKEISSEKKTGFLRQILKALRFFTFARKVYLISKKEQVDVLHAHAMFFCAFAAKLSSLLLAKPMVYEVRSLWEERYKDVDLFSKIIFNTITLIETLAMYLSDEIVAINNSLKLELSKRRLLVNKTIHIVENAVNLDRILIKKTDHKDLVFGYIGTISPIEGLDFLIKAFTNLYNKGIKNKLIFYGDGVELNQLKVIAQKNKMIDFKGRFNQDGISEAYSEIDVIINPRRKSFLTESVTPLKPLEAMGYQKLIMASNIGGMREIIKHNKTGILFQPDSVPAIEEAVLDVLERAETKQLVDAALRYVKENRSWKANAMKYILIYNNLVIKNKIKK